MKSILIIKTGETVPGTDPALGDFEDWIIDGMELPKARFDVVAVYRGEILPAPERAMAVIITGSSAMVSDRESWSEYTAGFLQQVIALGIPVLGICYGHQLIGHALGGRIDFNPAGREIGTVTVQSGAAAKGDLLLSAMPASFPAHSSHAQSVLQLPGGAVVLAFNDHDAYHAVRFADRVWGLQFHPEFDETVMKTYLIQRREVLEAEGLEVDRLLSEVALTVHARQLLRRFGEIVDEYRDLTPVETFQSS